VLVCRPFLRLEDNVHAVIVRMMLPVRLRRIPAFRIRKAGPRKEIEMPGRALQVGFLIVFSLVFIAQSSFALSDVTYFRYGEKIVRIGDSQYEVITKIGGPVYVENKLEGERWIYEAKRIYYLTFSNDRLQRIQVGRRVK
jgi:hypothetical protein